MAQTGPNQKYAEPVQVALHVQSDGPFPFRIVYYHASSSELPGINLRYARLTPPTASTADSTDASSNAGGTADAAAQQDAAALGSAVFAFQNVPAGRLFTDAKLERELLLAGSVAGVLG